MSALVSFALMNTSPPRAFVSMVQGDERYDRITLITDLLFRFGVHMVDAFFSKDEISLILHEGDASKTFEVLRSQIR